MIAGNGRRFTTGGLAAGGLVALVIGGLIGAAIHLKVKQSVALQTVASGSDTPVIIMGGSIRFRANKADWIPCDGKPASSSTTCYRALFNNDKAKLKYFQYLDEYITPDTVPVTAAATDVTYGWEIDVLDTNITPKTVLVCAQSFDFKSCDHGPIDTNDSYIYVIAPGGGSFDLKGSKKYQDKLVYHDGDTQYDYINIIKFLPSHGSEKDESCGDKSDSNCTAYLSKGSN